MFTCRTCKSEWPENYCPVCASTIERPPGQEPPPPAFLGKMVPLKPRKARAKGELLGSVAFLLLGLFGLVMGIWFPIHVARTDPDHPVFPSLRMVLMSPMLVLISFAGFAGKIQNKTLITVLACIGLVIGFFLWFKMRSIVAAGVH